MGDNPTVADPVTTPPAPNAGDATAGNEPAPGSAVKPESTTPPATGTPPPTELPATDEPPVRKTPQDYYRERQEKREAKKQDDSQGQGSGDDPDDLDDPIQSTVRKVVDQEYGPVFESLRKEKETQQVKQEVDDFLSQPGNDVFRPYAEKIQKFALHTSRRSIPIESIAYEVAGKDLMRIGVERAKQADAEAAASVTGGGSPGNIQQKNWQDMSMEEFADHKKSLLRG